MEELPLHMDAIRDVEQCNHPTRIYVLMDVNNQYIGYTMTESEADSICMHRPDLVYDVCKTNLDNLMKSLPKFARSEFPF